MNLHTEIKTALEYHLHGDLQSAAALYDSILKTDPNQTGILHLAGVLALQGGDLKKARRLIARAISVAPETGEYCISLAAVLKAEGQLHAAREALEKAVELVPADADIINELGDIANAMGDYPAAVGYFSRAVSMAAEVPACHFNLGLAHRNQGDHTLALSCFKKAVQLDPGLSEAHYAIGNLMQDSGDFDAAIDCYRQVLQLSPGFSEAHYNMGNAAKSAGNPRLAADCYRRALEIQPDYAEAHNNLGLIFKDDGLYSQAATHFEKALTLKPHLAESRFNLGVIAQMGGNHEAGLKFFQETLQIRPDYAPAKWMWHLSLPILYKNPQEIDRYRQRFKTHLALLIGNTPLETSRDIEAALSGVGAMTNFYLQYQGRHDRELQTLYGGFVSKVMMTAYPQWGSIRSMPPLPAGTKIRVGYVSSFMRAHTIGEFLAGWLEHHDHDQFEIYCYHIGTQTDIMTARFKKHSAAFHQIGADLEKAATQILADDLHLLVYTDIGMNALATQLAALRLAPIQCKGWGHPVTTGLPTIDYYLSSDLMEPVTGREHYSETLIRLPNLALAYTPPTLPQQPKSRSHFGLREDAFVCLNTQSLFKLLPQHDDIYPRIALQLPAVQFVFLTHKDREITQQFEDRLAEAFAGCGLKFEDFCRIVPRQNFPDFLSLNLCCDLLLDSMEWSGGKTTLEAISCGLPVVTRPGNLMRGRHACAMLAMMGIDATIAKDKDDYIQIAVRLCSDEHFYAGVKEQIATKRDRLYADVGCIRALENFYRSICRKNLPKMVIKEDISFLVHPGDKCYHGVPFWDAVNANQWEADTFRLIRKFCSPHRSFIDIGAWIGPTALYAANFAQHVYAVEPDPIAIDQFKVNLHLNPHISAKTTLFEGCLSNTKGKTTIASQSKFGDSETSMMFRDQPKKEIVAALTFADFVLQYNISDCALIKMDIEGAESLVLPGMVDYLREAKPALLLSLHPHLYGASPRNIIRNIYILLSDCYNCFYHSSGEKIASLSAMDRPISEIFATSTHK